jgi:proline iminopeptidase
VKPDKYTLQEIFIKADHGHQIYVHEWGNSKSKQVILNFHGGPGSGTSESSKIKYNPDTQHVIFFDQRGSGRSLPLGELSHNNTAELISDINLIVKTLELKDIVLVGSSWGSTLALCYAIAHPSKVKALILDGILLGSHEDITLERSGAWQSFFPEVWHEFVESVPPSYRNDPFDYYLHRSIDKDPEVAKRAIYACMNLEASILSLDSHLLAPGFEDFDEIPGSIELHYLRHKFFINQDYILKNADKIKAPVYIVQGRYDMVCPPINAFRLDQALLNSHLIWTINGHLKQHEASNITKLILDELS